MESSPMPNNHVDAQQSSTRAASSRAAAADDRARSRSRVVVERARERTQRWTSRRAIEGVIARILSTREDRRRRVSLLARASWTR
jgi:hypothetical protein